MLMNIDTELDRRNAGRVVANTTSVVVEAKGRVLPTSEPQGVGQRLVVDIQDWTWRDLRDYVVGEIQRIHGDFPRNANVETGTFKSFFARWPDGHAAAIAKYAFEVERGMWFQAPISVSRFTKGSDPFFAEVIWKKIEHALEPIPEF